MRSYSHTGEVRGHNQSLARACSFESSPRLYGSRWRVHKGVIMERYGKFKTVVKNPTKVDNASAQVFAEVNKYNFAKSVLQRCPDLANRIELVPVYHSNIKKIGRGWLIKNGTKYKGNFHTGGPVLIQERIEDPIDRIFEIGENCPTLPLDADDQIPLLALAHESYSSSGGECVITGIKGAKVRDDRGVMTYHVTSLTIHSLGKKFGETDRGFAGVAAYKNWNFSRQQTSQRRYHAGSQGVSPWLCDDVILELASLPTRTVSSRPPESLGPNLPLYVELLNRDPQLRHFLNEDSLRQLLGQPPIYSFTSANLQMVAAGA
ncbi:uncharacterized protein [Littorina saxatilis]|uniref:Alpha-type protein kinase domain-containing protein n=2 Tax=Littorina saxatilis TaxID=31220 RepID=A0AAN9BFR3_9CAEN